MSKASEWARALREVGERQPEASPPFDTQSGPGRATVTNDGRACISCGTFTVWMEGDAAVILARYLLEMFAESGEARP